MTSKFQNSKNYQGEAKFFFQRDSWKKVLAFLFFLIIAFGFWFLQTMQQSFEIEMPIAIKFTNIPSGIVLDNNTPTKINVKIKDKGTILLRYFFNRNKKKEIEIDLQDLDLKKTSYILPKKKLETKVENQLLSTSTQLAIIPDALKIEYQGLQKKELPVILSGQLTPAIGYVLIDTMLFTPKKIYAYGSKNALDSLTGIYTETIEIQNITSHIQKQIKLNPPKGILLNEKNVELNVSAEEFTEKVIQIPIICKNIPENYFVRLFPPIVDLTVQVVLSDYGKIDASNFEVIVDYADLIKNKDYKATLTLSTKPDWIKSYKLNPEKIEFLIEQKKK